MPPIRARDLRANIADMGFERGVVHTVELLIGECIEQRQHLRELTELVSQCINQVDQMVVVGGAMKDQLQLIKREQSQRGDTDGEAS